MRKAIPFLVLATALASQVALAQPSSTVATSSAPGKASAVATTEVTAQVTAIDKATRTVTLKGPQGKTMDIVAGEEVRNFNQIKVGDKVTVQYAEALSLELKKSATAGAPTETVAAARAKEGDKPAGIVGRQVTVMAEVVAVDPVKSTITLKGPKGKMVELNVKNPDQFKVVKVGDKVEAVYTEALAMTVTPAPKAAAKK